MPRYSIRSIDGERTIQTGHTDEYMDAQDIAAQCAKTRGDSVYLWFADRAPVRVDAGSATEEALRFLNQDEAK